MTDEYRSLFKNPEDDQKFEIMIRGSMKDIPELAKKIESLLVGGGMMDFNGDPVMIGTSNMNFDVKHEELDGNINFRMEGNRNPVRNTAAKISEIIEESESFRYD